MPTYEGRLDAKGLRIALLASRFNETITKSLLDGARSALQRHGADDAGITIAWVPGAFELPLAASRLAASGEFDAVVCLGAVIRGATAHFEHVAGQAAAGTTRPWPPSRWPTCSGSCPRARSNPCCASPCPRARWNAPPSSCSRTPTWPWP